MYKVTYSRNAYLKTRRFNKLKNARAFIKNDAKGFAFVVVMGKNANIIKVK